MKISRTLPKRKEGNSQCMHLKGLRTEVDDGLAGFSRV